MTQEAPQTFIFNDTEYSFEDISDKAKYIIGHINELQAEESKIKRDLDKNNVTSQAFSQLLGEELAPKEEVEEEYEVVED